MLIKLTLYQSVYKSYASKSICKVSSKVILLLILSLKVYPDYYSKSNGNIVIYNCLVCIIIRMYSQFCHNSLLCFVMVVQLIVRTSQKLKLCLF